MKYGHCAATTKKGNPCPTGKLKNSDFCHVHAKAGQHQTGIALFTANGQLNELAYRQYLKSPRWRQKREARKNQDGYRCVRCGSSERLEVHHISYQRLGWEPLSDLRTLCRQCHQEISDLERKVGREKANAEFKSKRSRSVRGVRSPRKPRAPRKPRKPRQRKEPPRKAALSS